MITDWTETHTKHEAMEIIGAAGVPAGAVLDTMELYNDPTFEKRNIMQTIQHPTVGAFKMVGWPVRFSGNPPPVKPAPLLGANNEDVLTQLARSRSNGDVGASGRTRIDKRSDRAR